MWIKSQFRPMKNWNEKRSNFHGITKVKRKALLNVLIIFNEQLHNCAPMRAHVLFKVKYMLPQVKIYFVTLLIAEWIENQDLFIPEICHFFTHKHFESWKFYTRKVRKFTTKLPRNSVNHHRRHKCKITTKCKITHHV